MYSKTHSLSIKGDNSGSCKSYAEYLNKSEGLFFNDKGSYKYEEVHEDIDKHGKGQLSKEDAKFYAPVYSFSENESKFLAEQITGRKVENYNDLSNDEKEKYNKRIQELAIKYQDQMAENFNKEDIGIKKGSDLKWYAKIENERYYKGYDEEVKKGSAKSGEQKKGFNTHIHVIQSRKANNEKKSKLSPESTQKNRSSNNKVQQGFDRQKFKNRIEETFDKETGYNRHYTETYDYYRNRKLNKLEHQEQLENKNKDNMKTIKQHHLEVSNSENIDNYKDYQKEMEKRGIEIKEIQNREKETYDLKLKNEQEEEKFSDLIKEEQEVKSKWVQEQKERQEEIEKQIREQVEREQRNNQLER